MTEKDRRILQKIISYVHDITDYSEGMDFDSFLSDKKTISACAFSVSQIGELAKELSDKLQNAHSEIPWKAIAF